MRPEPLDHLTNALELAIAGRLEPLAFLISRKSRLPGPHPNDSFAEAFARACAARGSQADTVALELARLDANNAPGATAREFLPVCGVLAIGARAAADSIIRPVFLSELQAHADDLRFHVRDAVVAALARIGGTEGDALVVRLDPWMDGYFHAAAVVRALSDETWLTRLHLHGPVAQRLDQAFCLARDAPRAAARYPGRKALLVALGAALVPVALRFGAPALDLVAQWSETLDPELRALIKGVLTDRRLAAAFPKDVERVTQALEASQPPPRNPDHDVGPTRDRSKTRRRTTRRGQARGDS